MSSEKWIRSINNKPAGKVIADDAGGGFNPYDHRPKPRR
jgi:hypothetical protein